MKSFLHRYGGRLLIGFAAFMLAVGIFFFVYVIRAKYEANEYIIQLGASFNAASLLNGAETYTDPEKAVIAEYDGVRTVIVPENYKALNTLLRKDCVMPLLPDSFKNAPLTITVCGQAVITIQPEKNSVDSAQIRFDTGTHTYCMRVSGGNVWTMLVQYATEGSNSYKNISLSE